MIISIKDIDSAIAYSHSKLNKKIAIISITCLNDTLPAFNVKNEDILGILELHFNDIEREYGDYEIPKKEDFKELKSFIDNHKGRVEEIAVHCHAGISRSSATASAICRYLNVDDSFIWDNFMYHPNRLDFRLALESLGLSINQIELDSLYKRNEYAHELSPYYNETEKMLERNDDGEVVSIRLT